MPDTKPRYRVGPTGIREVVTVGSRTMLFPVLPPPVELDPPEIRIRLLTREEIIERDGIDAVLQRERDEDRRRRTAAELERARPYYEHGRRVKDAGSPPQYAAWCNDRIVHMSYVPWCGNSVTMCGYRTEPHWTTAIGIPEDRKGRLCLRCQARMAQAVAMASGLPREEWPNGREFRRDPIADAKLWGKP